ncbi:MAG: 50S ribosomal protein L4 [Gammaproteobacteria bacterium]|nr:50S ribosomal protein L4 [Gammaproteobacteria bacterium]
MKVTLTNESGKKQGSEIEVSDAVFGATYNQALVHQVVIAFQANGRQGTRKQLTRSEVRGGGRKPFRQKGTGSARAGTIRSPLWRGGGKIFPSTPDENFTHKVNRKMFRGAVRSILSELLRSGRLIAVADFTLPQSKTKEMVAKLKGLDAPDVLIVTEVADDGLALAARNLHKVDVRPVSAADPFSLLRHEKVVMTAGALKRFEAWLA